MHELLIELSGHNVNGDSGWQIANGKGRRSINHMCSDNTLSMAC